MLSIQFSSVGELSRDICSASCHCDSTPGVDLDKHYWTYVIKLLQIIGASVQQEQDTFYVGGRQARHLRCGLLASDSNKDKKFN